MHPWSRFTDGETEAQGREKSIIQKSHRWLEVETGLKARSV